MHCNEGIFLVIFCAMEKEALNSIIQQFDAQIWLAEQCPNSTTTFHCLCHCHFVYEVEPLFYFHF